jgi:hypothetical protein
VTDHLTFGLRKQNKLHAAQRRKEQKMFHGINHHTVHVTQGNQKKDTVQNSQMFDGSHNQTRGFLAGFQIWVAAQEEVMNSYKTG